MKDWNEITPKKMLLILLITALFVSLLSGCVGTYYLSDAEYSDAREENAVITYYDNQIYSGWSNGYYYYYGMPHYYPWYIYYNACPPSHYTHTTHIVITRPVNRPTHRPNRPTHRPNRPKNDNTRIYVKPNKSHNTNIKVKTNTRVNTNTKVKTNTRVKTNNKTKVTNRRRPK